MAKLYRFDFEVAKRIPSQQKFATNQMLRASLSGVLNIGEAGGRESPGESAQHLRYARGSVYESAAMLDALSLMGGIGDEEYNRQEELLARIGAMLTVMIRKKGGLRGRARARSRSRSPSRSRN